MKNPAKRTAAPPVRRIEQVAALGELVRHQRLQEQLRIDDAAALCGVSVDLFSRLENGGRVTSDRLLKVLDGLGLCVLVVPRAQVRALENHAQQLAADSAPVAP